MNKNEYSLFVNIKDLDIDAFCCNDLTYLNSEEEELKKFKGDTVKVKILEIKPSNKKLELVLGSLITIH